MMMMPDIDGEIFRRAKKKEKLDVADKNVNVRVCGRGAIE